MYPTYISKEFDFWYTSTLIVAISVTLFSQYFFGIVYQLLLNADQRTYIVMAVSSVTLLANTIACSVLMVNGASIQAVKIVTSIVFLTRPIILSAYVSKHYNINKKIKLSGEPIKQKWNGFAQHIAYVVLNNTDTIVLSVFSTLENVSIYGIYNLVVNMRIWPMRLSFRQRRTTGLHFADRCGIPAVRRQNTQWTVWRAFSGQHGLEC